MATPADTRTQQRPVNRTIETAAQPAITATAQSLSPLPAGRGRGRALSAWTQSRVMGTIPEPGGIQQQTANGEELETGCLGQQGRRTIAWATDFTADASTSALLAIVPLPVGGVQQSTAPAWIRALTGGLALAGGVLRHQTPSGSQQEGNQTPTEEWRCTTEGRLAMERARWTTLPARANTETRVPGVTPGGVQQPSSRQPMATSDRNVSPSPHTNGAPQNRAASGDRLSPRPTLRQRRRSPSPAAVDRAMVPRPVGRRRWTTTPAWMRARTIGGLQHQASSGAQQERDRASATVGRRPLQVPPLVERESMNATTQGPRVASNGPQQLKSRRSLPTTGGNAPPSSRIIGTRGDRAASCGRPSPRPTARPRHRSPLP